MASIPHQPYGAVYCIENLISGRVYIGLTIQEPRKRWRWHRHELRHNTHTNPHLQHAWNKYGEGAFEFAVLEHCENIEALNDAEMFYIEYLRAMGAALYNQKTGGGFGGSPSAETRQRLSKAGKGRKRKLETCAAISQATTGVKKTRTLALKAQWEAQRGRREDPEQTKRRIDAVVATHPVRRFRAPDGTIYETRNVAALARRHGLNERLLHYVVTGKQHHHRGWKLADD